MVALEPPAAAAASANGPTDGAPKDGTKVTLPILSEVRSAQGAHGLKLGGDFLRYRQYCTRRLARVRSSTSTTNGRGRYSATPITPTIVASDARTLLVPLYLAERAWAYAMDVKREQKSGPARSRRTVVARLSKAVGHAKELRTLCAATADAETCLEAEAYARWMAATLALEKEEWTPALAEFEAAQQLYGGLAGVAQRDGGRGCVRRPRG